MSREPNHPRAGTSDHPPHYIREWRDFMRWTQEDLADMAHVSQSKIARIESGERKLKTEFLRDLARVFRVPQSALLEVDPSTKDGAQTASMLLAWNELTEAQRADMLKMMQAIARSDNGADAG